MGVGALVKENFAVQRSALPGDTRHGAVRVCVERCVLVWQGGILAPHGHRWRVASRSNILRARVSEALFGRIFWRPTGGDGSLAEMGALDLPLELAQELETDRVQTDAPAVAGTSRGLLDHDVISLAQLVHLDHVQRIAGQMVHLHVRAGVATGASVRVDELVDAETGSSVLAAGAGRAGGGS